MLLRNLLFCLFIFCCACTQTPKIIPETLTEGTVEFEIAITAPKDSAAGTMAMFFPTTGSFYFTTQRAALYVVAGMGMVSMRAVSYTQSSDTQPNRFAVFIDMVGDADKILTADTADIRALRDSAHVVLTKTTERKTILEIPTVKYIVTDTLKKTMAYLFVAEQVPVKNIYAALPFGGEIQGLILEYIAKSDKGTLRLTAKKITPSVSAKDFDLPTKVARQTWRSFREAEKIKEDSTKNETKKD